MKKLTQKGFAALEAVLIIIILALIAGFGYYTWQHQNQKQDNKTSASSSSKTDESSAPVETGAYAGWKTYTSVFEGASFKYPNDWKLTATYNDYDTSGKQGAPSPANGEMVTVQSPDGFKMSWDDPVMGIGGACDPTQDPHIFIDHVINLPVQGSRNPLYIVVFSINGHKSIGVIDEHVLSSVPTVGDTGSCLVYAIFQSKRDNGSEPDIVSFGDAGQITTTPNNANLTDTQYLAQPDIQTAIKIFESLSY